MAVLTARPIGRVTGLMSLVHRNCRNFSQVPGLVDWDRETVKTLQNTKILTCFLIYL